MKNLIVIILLSFVFIKCVDANASALQAENADLKDSISNLISWIGVEVVNVMSENDSLKAENDILKAEDIRLRNLIIAKDNSFDSLQIIMSGLMDIPDTLLAWYDRLVLIKASINGQ